MRNKHGTCNRWRYRALLFLIAVLAGCSWIDRTLHHRIKSMELTPAAAPSVTRHRLSNGITLLHRRSTANDIVAVVGYMNGGAATDEAGKEGRTFLMSRVLTRGTTSRSSLDIATSLEEIGASVSAGTSMDQCSVTLRCLRGDLDQAFDLYADVILHPTFPASQIDLERQAVLAAIRQENDSSSTQAIKRLRAELFGPHPYGRPIRGEPASVSALGQTDLFESWKESFLPSHMTFCLVGDVEFDQARALFEKHFAGIPADSTTRVRATRAFAPNGSLRRIAKEIDQAFIAMGLVTGGVLDDDSAALDVATAVLGSGMSSRLHGELRERQGLAYAVGATDNLFRDAGYFLAYIGTGPGNIDKACDGLWTEVKALREEPVPEAELDRAKTYLAGTYLLSHEHNADVAGYLAYWESTGRGAEYDAEYPRKLKAVTSRDVMRVANRYFVDPCTVILEPMGTPKAAVDIKPKPGQSDARLAPTP